MQSSTALGRIGIGVCLAALALPLLAACGGGGGTHIVQPAERHLAYLAGDDPEHATVWLANVDGTHAHPLGKGSAAALSPDGRTIAVQRPNGIYLLSADGKQARRLTTHHLHPQAWSPDGKTLIATRTAPLTVLELDAVDKATGKVRVIGAGSMYGFSFSPDGSKLVYSRAPVSTGQGLCGDQFDLYVTKISGGKSTRITRDGVSAFPVWGRSGIAYSRFPEGTGLAECSAPGIWTVDDDGSNPTAVVARAPGELSQDGLYGLQPIAWLDDTRILAGIRTNSGMLGAILDTKKKGRVKTLVDFVDAASSDGRYVVGSGGDEDNVHLAIVRLKDGHRVFRKVSACCPSWNR
jgi:dipeptidyl aminopeptidase/acylaminoacyl peptidase